MDNDFIVITNGYPSEGKLYNNGFVHSRVIKYMENGYSGFVIVLRSDLKKFRKYIFKNVVVYEGNSNDIISLLNKYKNSKIFIHFVDRYIMSTLKSSENKSDIYIWIHGTEALSWKRRLFNLRWDIKSILSFCKYIIYNTMQMKFMKNLILSDESNMKFIFVSNWMREVLEKDTGTKIKKNKYYIIPNVVNNDLFKFQQKINESRFNIISIRPYTSRKYANDISVKVVQALSGKEYFQNLNFSFYGDGYLFDKTLEPIKNFKNVKIEKGFKEQNEIIELYNENGIILSPTRQDAQGVTMCEAISSGLVPIVSKNTAIPEFVKNDFGYLCNDISEFVRAFDDIYYNPEGYVRKSKIGAKFIENKCGNKVIASELDIIEL